MELQDFCRLARTAGSKDSGPRSLSRRDEMSVGCEFLSNLDLRRRECSVDGPKGQNPGELSFRPVVKRI